MLKLKVELIGDRVGVVLDDATRAVLNVKVGDVIALRRTAQGELVVESAEVGDDGRHQRGRAFLKRYLQSFTG